MTSIIVIVAIVVLLQLGSWREVARRRRIAPQYDAADPIDVRAEAFDPAAFEELDVAINGGGTIAPAPVAPETPAETGAPRAAFTLELDRILYGPGLCSPRRDLSA